MSPSELLRQTGLHVSTRQFRRYLAGGLIPGVVRGKGGHYAVKGPVTPARIARIKERILKFRGRPGRKKLRNIVPVNITNRKRTDVKFPGFTLGGSMIEFQWWMNQCDPLDSWTDAEKRNVLGELVVPAAVALRLADDLKEEIIRWDGTKGQLARLRR